MFLTQNVAHLNELGNIEQWWAEQFGFGFECLTKSKQDTLSRLRQAKESGKVSKNILTDNNLKHSRLILFVKSALTQRGVARMLSSMELEELRSTKKIAAERTMLIVRTAIK